MATKIIHKKSSVAGNAPDSSDLSFGELAINYADGQLFFKRSDNEVKRFLDSAGIATAADARINITGVTVARSSISVADDANDGSLTYDSATGTITHVGTTPAQTRAHFSAGGDATYDSSAGRFSVTTYKTADFNTDFTGRSTTHLSEGTNLYYTSTRVDSDIDSKVDSAYISLHAPDMVLTNSTQTLINKTFTDPNFGDSVTFFGKPHGSITINKDDDYGDSTQSTFAFISKDSSQAAVIAVGVKNNVTHALGTLGDADSNELVIGLSGTNSKLKIMRNIGEKPFDLDGQDAAGDVLLKIENSGQVHIPYDQDATTKTNAALTILGGLGVSKTIRATSVRATDLHGDLTGDVTGQVSSIANHSTDDLQEGADPNKFYYTTTRFDSDFNDKTTNDLTEHSTALYYTTARADSDAKHAISSLDQGGDGSLSYSSDTGIITYNGPSASETRAHFNPGTGVTYDSGTGKISIAQSVGTGDSVEFGGGLFSGNVTINGNLNVAGTQTTNNYVDLRISEPLIKVADSNNADIFDLGLVGRYSDDGGTTIRRAGFIRDASTGEWHVFANLVQDGLDSSNPDKTINIYDSTVEYPTWNFGKLRGSYLGFDSDFRVFSTNYTLYTSNFTAINAGRYALDTSGGTFNITLPANPTTGDYVRFIDAGNLSTTPVTILRNGSTIEGSAEDFELDVGQNIIEFLFINNTWNVYASIGQRGPEGPRGPAGADSDAVTVSQSIAYSIALG